MDEVETLPSEAPIEPTQDCGGPAGSAFQAPHPRTIATDILPEGSSLLQRPEGHLEPFRLDEREAFPDDLFGPTHPPSHGEDEESPAPVSEHSHLPPIPGKDPCVAAPKPPTRK